MFLIPTYIRRLFRINQESDESRIFLQDQEMIVLVRKVAEQQDRSEEEVITDFARMGWNQYWLRNDLDQCWDSLSDREQEVTALICLGYRNYEIANTLSIAPGTVKAHLQNIFAKFNIRSRRELRHALKDWDFIEWWDRNQHS